MLSHNVTAREPTIPQWTSQGVVPPIRPGLPGHVPDRAPYIATLSDVVLRFGNSEPRRKILRGLLDFRAELRRIGFTDGFQWLDGSLFEDVETNRGTPPNDVDVVTFTALGDEAQQYERLQKDPHVLDPVLAKEHFKVDSYFVPLGEPLGPGQVQTVSYWYSLWSHRRGDYLWKGFAQVPLECDDEAALALLNIPDGGGGAP